jgi:hypothetical protein
MVHSLFISGYLSFASGGSGLGFGLNLGSYPLPLLAPAFIVSRLLTWLSLSPSQLAFPFPYAAAFP